MAWGSIEDVGQRSLPAVLSLASGLALEFAL